MKLTITSVHGRGKFNDEYVLLKAMFDCNMSSYILADTTYVTPQTISNKSRNMHWFLGLPLKTGEHVIFYTKSGTYSRTTNPSGMIFHHVYWGLQAAVWNNTGDYAHLFEIADRQVLKA
jgi:hypothetical protein